MTLFLFVLRKKTASKNFFLCLLLIQGNWKVLSLQACSSSGSLLGFIFSSILMYIPCCLVARYNPVRTWISTPKLIFLKIGWETVSQKRSKFSLPGKGDEAYLRNKRSGRNSAWGTFLSCPAKHHWAISTPQQSGNCNLTNRGTSWFHAKLKCFTLDQFCTSWQHSS